MLFAMAGVPMCARGHVMVVSYEREDKEEYRCSLCAVRERGDRWSCEDCPVEYCFSCLTKERSNEGLK